MNRRIIKVITFIAAVITILTSMLYLTSKIMIPALAPFSLSIVMLGVVYSAKEQLNEGKIKKDYLRITYVLGLIAFAANIIAGIAQIINAVMK